MFSERTAAHERRRREVQQVELRQQRTEDLLKKKREDALKNEGPVSFKDLKEKMCRNDLPTIYQAAYECRATLSVECNPPIQEVIEAGIVPRCVELLETDFYARFPNADRGLVDNTRIEAAWIITNVASGTKEDTAYVVGTNCVPSLVKMLHESDDAIIDQAVWALGNIAGDCERTRDCVLSYNALPIILNLSWKYRVAAEHIKILRNVVWLMANLSRGANPRPPSEVFGAIYDNVKQLVQLEDRDIVADCFWSLSYIVDGEDKRFMDDIMSSFVISRSYEILASFAGSLMAAGTPDRPAVNPALARIGARAVAPIVRMIGNIIANSDPHTDAIISNGFLGLFHPFFYRYTSHNVSRLRKDICWVISNVAAGTKPQIEYVVSSDLFSIVMDSLSNYEIAIRKEASHAVCNLLFNTLGNQEVLIKMLNMQLMEGIQTLLPAVSNRPETQLQLLDSVMYALETGEKVRITMGDNPVVQKMIDTGLVDDIEHMQLMENDDIAAKAYHIIMTHFDGVCESNDLIKC